MDLGTDAPLLDAIDEALYRHGIPPDHVRHLLFTFSGNAPEALLTQALAPLHTDRQAADPPHGLAQRTCELVESYRPVARTRGHVDQ